VKYYHSKTVSLRYDKMQDRLQWVSHCKDNKLVFTWFTRSMLNSILPKLAEWLDEQSEKQSKQENFTALDNSSIENTNKKSKPNSESKLKTTENILSRAKTPVEKKSVHRFIHEEAQQQINFKRDHLDKNQKPAVDFLLNSIQFSQLINNQIRLILIDDSASIGVIYRMTSTEVHKIIGELIRMSDGADWKLANPWHKPFADQTISNNEILH